MAALFRDPSRLLFLDRLTQLYNWWFMAQYLRERFGVLAAHNLPLSVLLVNLDNFRALNEAHGRLAGDVVLRQVAMLLHEGRRRGGCAVRYAGDEFFVFLEGADFEAAEAAAEQTRARIAERPVMVPHAPAGIPVTASVGVVTFPNEVQTASALIEKARRGLAHAKRQGKNRVSRDPGDHLPTEKEALRQLHRPRLIGRERDVEALRSLLAGAAGGGNRFVLVDGEHGIGKSRLLSELPPLIRQAGLKFLQGGCLPQSQAVPYSTLSPLLQEYFDRDPTLIPPAAARLEGPRLAAVRELLSIFPAPKGPAEGTPAPERRRQLFHGLLDLLAIMSEATPHIILLEGLDWADQASLEVFLHLLSREEGHVAVIATATLAEEVTTDGRGKRRTLVDFLPYLQVSPQFQRLSLQLLSFLQVGDLAAGLLSHHIPARFHQQIFQVSRGVPLLVEETLTGLIRRGVLKQEEGAWNFEQVTPEDFPASADEAIARRLENLEPETLEVVSEASIMGSDVDLPILAEVLGRDPGELLQVVDRGRQSGVFDTADPLADAGEIRFANGRLRQIVYDGVDAKHRREVHRKAAEVYERLQGPEGTEALGPITYHFERSDATDRWSFYRDKLQKLRDWFFSPADVGEPKGGGGEGDGGGETVAEAAGAAAAGGAGQGGGGAAGTVRVRIVEATEPVGDELLPKAVLFVKTFTLACKNMRVFPEGSELVRDEVAGAAQAVATLLEPLEGITVAELRGGLAVNGRSLEGKALGPMVQDLLRVFREHGVRSLTFVRGVADSDIQELLRLLSGPPGRIPPQVAAWEKALEEKGVFHVGVLPAIYLASGARAAAAGEEALPGEEVMRLAAETFRSLAGAVDNLRLYPPENELNVAIQDRLEQQAYTLLEKVPAATLALAEDSIVINGLRPNPKLFGLTIPLLHKFMHDSALTSLTLTRGLTRADLQVFLTQLAQPVAEEPDPSVLTQLLEQHRITSIQVGVRAYAAARASLMGGGRPGGPGGSVTEAAPATAGASASPGTGGAGGPGTADGRGPGAASEEDRLFQQVTQWLETPGGSGLREDDIPAAVNAWLKAERTDLAQRLWERIMAGLADPLEGTRQRSAAALNVLLMGANAGTIAWLRGMSFEALERAMLAETSQRAFQWEARAAVEALKLLLKEGDFAPAARLAEALGREQAKRADQKRLAQLGAAAVESLAGAGGLEPLVAGLKDPGRRDAAGAVLAAFGEAAVGFVVRLIGETQDDEVRRAAAALLRALPAAALRLILPQLTPPTPGQTSRRIVSVLDLIVPEVRGDFAFLFAHPDVLVRAEFTALVSRLPRATALALLEEALEEGPPVVMAGALEAVRALKATELLEVIVRLLGRGGSPEALKAACLCLGQLKDTRAVDALVEVLEQRPRFLGFVKGLPDTVRAAAARALGELAAPEAREPLRAAAKDSSLAVRSTARLALTRLG